jgi:6,7-dimethyl-8-ribityllumazine synthase
MTSMSKAVHRVRAVSSNDQNSKLRIGVVVSRFNELFCQQMEASVLDELSLLGVLNEHITVVSVPGALEIPAALQALALKDEFDALIALGVVIRGQTYHFEVVSLHSAEGVMSVGLDHHIPIANGVLTVETEDQAQVRVEVKSRECARAAVEMVHLFHHIESV